MNKVTNKFWIPVFLLVCSASLPAQIVFNEVAPANFSGISDEESEYSDWIELYNAGAGPVSLGGFTISDDPASPGKWVLPDYTLHTGEYRLIWLSGKNRVDDDWHTNFKLKPGETLWLRSAGGQLLDSVTNTGLQPGDVLVRIPDGSANWCLNNQQTPGATNDNLVCYTGYAAAPVFSKPAGFYTNPQQISLSSGTPGATIRYTLFGTSPTTSDPIYGSSGPVNITNGVRPLRARAYAPGFLPSPVVTQTYAIGVQSTLPVVFMSTDPPNLFDFFTGIYEFGPSFDPSWPHYGANFWQDWERPVSIEYFPAMQEFGFAQNVGISIHGNWMRACEQKSFDLKSADRYGAPEFGYPLFRDKPWINRFDKFVLRNAGNDNNYTHLRDAIVQQLGRQTNADEVATDLAVLYINGNYWGVYQLYEAHDAYFPGNNGGPGENNIDIVRMYDGDTEAQVGTLDDWQEFTAFFAVNNLNDPAQYALLRNKYLDVDNFADYLFNGVYCGNWDWISSKNNVKAWHRREPYGPWRYILWDNDFSLGQGENYILENLLDGSISNEHEALAKKLLDTPAFRRFFINRSCDLLNTVFLPDSVKAVRDYLAKRLEPEMPRHFQRWTNGCYFVPGPVTFDEWFNRVNDEMTGHIDARPGQLWDLYHDQFDLGAPVNITLAVNPPGAGAVQISTVTPGQFPWTGVYFHGNPVTVTAFPAPGFSFSHWSPNTFISNVNAAEFSANVATNTLFTAHFTNSGAATDLTFSEINYNSDSTRSAGNWVELHNFGATPRSVGGYRLRTISGNNTYTLPANTTIPAGGYLVLADDLTQFQTEHPAVANVLGPTNVGLDNNGDTVLLLDPSGAEILRAVYDDILPWPQCADGHGRTLESAFPNDAAHLTIPGGWFDGCMGGSPGKAYSPCVQPLVFNEINYRSPAGWADAGDWVELLNHSGAALNLSGWKFADSNDDPVFVLPAGTTLPPDSFLVLYSSLTKLLAVHHSVPRRAGPFTFGLNGDGEVIRLYDSAGKLQLSMFYNDAAPWPPQPDGEGPTLELIDAGFDLNKGASWEASCLFGTPGRPNTDDCSTGVQEQQPAPFYVYPNPTMGSFRVVTSAGAVAERWQVFDGLGRLVLDGLPATGQSAWPVELSGVAAGSYLLKVFTGSGVWVKMVVVQ